MPKVNLETEEVSKLKSLLEIAEIRTPQNKKIRNRANSLASARILIRNTKTKNDAPAYSISPIPSTHSLYFFLQIKKFFIYRKEKDEIGGDNRACVKAGPKKRQLEYENARLYFLYREKGFPDRRAIPMANRLRCTTGFSERKNSAYQIYQKKVLNQALDRKVNEAVNNVRKECVVRVKNQYIETYKNVRQDILENVDIIYSHESNPRLNTAPEGTSPKKDTVRTYFRNLNGENSKKKMELIRLKERIARNDSLNSNKNILARNRRITIENPWEKHNKSQPNLKISSPKFTKEIERKIEKKLDKAAKKREIALENIRQKNHIDHVYFY